MGNKVLSSIKLNYEDIQYLLKLKDKEKYILINTLDNSEQECLILNTVRSDKEEYIINSLLNKNKSYKIIIYGKNCNDEKIFNKYNQLISLGFNNVYIYIGGLFEWLLLQDIYGEIEFPTTKKELDILKYKPINKLR